MSRRPALLALMGIGLVALIAAPALVLAGVRFLSGDAISVILGIGVALLVLFVVIMLVVLAARPR